MQRYFITGIGTEVGKTLIATIITEALEADYWKPIQAGDLVFSDTDKVKALVLNKTSVFHPNSYALNTPMSPHASAAIDGVDIKIAKIKTPPFKNKNIVVEGAGGLLVPINDSETIIDLIEPNDKIILVSKHYLGSINHTLLSVETLKNRGFKNIGILFNGDEHPTTETIIKKMTEVKILGRIGELSTLSPEVISAEAQKIKTTLLNF